MANVVDRKHAQRLDRLAAINESRMQKVLTRRSQSTAASNPRESVDGFVSTFAEKREFVEKGLATICDIDAATVKEKLEVLSTEVVGMEKLLAESAYFLPSYDIRTSQTSISTIKEQIDNTMVTLIPKKKFSFRNKGIKAPPIVESNDNKSYSRDPLSCTLSRRGEARVSQNPSPEDSFWSGGLSVASAERFGQTGDGDSRIEAKSGSTFVRDFKVSDEVEFTLSNLTDCVVYLRGRLRTLFLHSLKSCQVFSGPVTGSVFIEEVTSSVLMLASHQIRIHSTTTTDFYLRVRSRPIIEYTSEVRFAPYAFAYAGLHEDLEASSLAEDTGLWDKIDDFRWLRAVHSPNWSVIPEEGRLIHDGSHVGDNSEMDKSNILGVYEIEP